MYCCLNSLPETEIINLECTEIYEQKLKSVHIKQTERAMSERTGKGADEQFLFELACVLLKQAQGEEIHLDVEKEYIEEKYPEINEIYKPLCEKIFALKEGYTERVHLQKQSIMSEYLYTIGDMLRCLETKFGEKFEVHQYYDKILINPERYNIREIVIYKHYYWGLYRGEEQQGKKEDVESCIKYGLTPQCYIVSANKFIYNTTDIQSSYIDHYALCGQEIQLGEYILGVNEKGLVLCELEVTEETNHTEQ